MEDGIFHIISNFGFPALVCFYLMTTVVKAVDRNTTALDALKEELKNFLTKHQ